MDFEYIVLGLGGIGSAALYWLSCRAGKDVFGIEQFELGHVRGESQDHSRIIRLSYHTPDYVKLAQRAYQCWEEVESHSKDRIVFKTGGLDLWPANSIIAMSDYTRSLRCSV
jgi:sarcosine oxidase